LLRDVFYIFTYLTYDASAITNMVVIKTFGEFHPEFRPSAASSTSSTKTSLLTMSMLKLSFCLRRDGFRSPSGPDNWVEVEKKLIFGRIWIKWNRGINWMIRDRCYDFLKYLRPKNLAKILSFFAQTSASYFKNLIITLVFEKNANIWGQKSQKIVTIASTPRKKIIELRRMPKFELIWVVQLHSTQISLPRSGCARTYLKPGTNSIFKVPASFNCITDVCC
jgi:hypothetical protein